MKTAKSNKLTAYRDSMATQGTFEIDETLEHDSLISEETSSLPGTTENDEEDEKEQSQDEEKSDKSTEEVEEAIPTKYDRMKGPFFQKIFNSKGPPKKRQTAAVMKQIGLSSRQKNMDEI